ncbi:putative reverse transcriptase Ty1/copia-type domain-containing protein [Phytophthora infestans]|uniref:Putative reverse transcriptase Ty1/copia-type domain-containing protein n=1 Tax=Phytophthora infestans TaxID=4787 RepID=A0A833SKN7_PHYIN|nr:putative reverse transcriptase Ty1/copia-type domain-containing protein [Phytophthora infestans]
MDTRRSVTGQVVTLGGCVVAYQSKLQPSAVKDTCSAELTAASCCADRIRWLQNLLAELQVPVELPALLWTDNAAAVPVMTHSSGHHKIKCLDLVIYKVIDYVDAGYIVVKHMPSKVMPADALTKPLGKGKFRQHRK